MKQNRLNAARQRETKLMACLPLLFLVMAFVPGMLSAQSSQDYTYGALHGASSFIDYRFERKESFSPYIDPLLVPIGWSKDGKLAYVVEHNYDGIGVGPVFVWIIQDMVSDVILGYRVVAQRSDKKSKSLSTVLPEGRSMVLDVQVAGYLQSPFEGRIAVVLCTTTRGWEGPPNPVSYSMGGCNLKLGFK